MLATGVVSGARTGAARPLAVVLDFILSRSTGDGAHIFLSLPGVCFPTYLTTKPRGKNKLKDRQSLRLESVNAL